MCFCFVVHALSCRERGVNALVCMSTAPGEGGGIEQQGAAGEAQPAGAGVQAAADERRKGRRGAGAGEEGGRGDRGPRDKV
eukprot:scaffold69250_cov32-Prasinocladus_malaysianus.AAC.1